MIYKSNKKKFKLPFLHIFNYFYKKYRLFKKKSYKLRAKRHEKISKCFSKKIVYIYQGRVWVKIKLTKYHVGYKFGEFACTKKPFVFIPKKKKQKR